MPSMRVWPVVAAGVCAAAMVTVAGAAALGTLGPLGGSPTAGSVTGQDFSACLPPEVPEENLGNPAIAACIESVYLSAIQGQGLTQADQAMREAEQLNPLLAYVCHDISHSVGKKALSVVGSLESALSALKANSCSNGIMHGVTDQMALEPVTDEELRKAASTCERVMPERLMDCADALGHLYWTSAPELPTAALRCDWFTVDSGKRACTTGIIMRMSAPQEGTGTPRYTAAEVLDACLDWPLGGKPYEHGCATGLAFAVYSDTSARIQDELLSVRQEGTDGDVQGLLSKLRPGQTLCESLPDPISQARCIAVLGDNLVMETQMIEVLPLWCAEVPRHAYPLCIARQPDSEVDSQGRPVDGQRIEDRGKL